MQQAACVVILVNPMPRLYVADLVRYLTSRSTVSVITFYRSRLLGESIVRQCIEAGADVRQYSFSNSASYVAQLVRASREIRQLVEGHAADVFICQPNHLLTNFASFHLAEQYGCRVHLIPDGLANFYQVGLAPYRAKMIAKGALGALISAPYRVYCSNYLGLGDVCYADYWYAGDAGIMGDYLPLKKFEVDRPLEVHAVEPAEVLFLGQHGAGRQFERAYRAVLQEVAEAWPGGVHYKPHPAEAGSGSWRRSIEGVGIEWLDCGDVAAEALALSYPAVAGVASSVLFNLRVFGWHSRVHGVIDADRLAVLLGRSRSETATIAAVSRSIGILDLSVLPR